MNEHVNYMGRRRALNNLQLKVHSLHAPFSGVDITSLDEGQRKNSLHLVKRLMEFCLKVEGEIVVVHPCSTEILADVQKQIILT